MGHGPHRSDNYRSGSPLPRLRPARTVLLTGKRNRRRRLEATTRAQRGFRRIFSTACFIPPPRPLSSSAAKPAPAEVNTNIFVSGLSKRTTTEKLREAFSHFGEVLHAGVVTDRVKRYRRDIWQGAHHAHLLNMFLEGWVIFAEYARPRHPASQAQINDFPWI